MPLLTLTLAPSPSGRGMSRSDRVRVNSHDTEAVYSRDTHKE